MMTWRQVVLAGLLACGVAGQALAHAIVKQSQPAAGAVLTASPREVKITFNEKVEAMFTSATVKNAAGATVSQEKATLDPADSAVLRLPVPTLAPGAYTVKWNAVGSDGHRRNGEIRFSVK